MDLDGATARLLAPGGVRADPAADEGARLPTTLGENVGSRTTRRPLRPWGTFTPRAGKPAGWTAAVVGGVPAVGAAREA